MPWPVATRLLFRGGGLLAAASLSSVEAEELEPADVVADDVVADEAGCMSLIFWLTGVLVQMGYAFQ